jgi:hypothetical protein
MSEYALLTIFLPVRIIELSLSNCGKLDSSSLVAAKDHCTHLVKLDLSNFSNYKASDGAIRDFVG